MTYLRPAALAFILASFGCGGKPASQATPPSEPAIAVERFLAAVKANDLKTMGDVWGSEKGPVNSWMSQADREKRLMVMQVTLMYESFAIDPLGPMPGASEQERVVRVQLLRNNCRPTVPFTVLRYRDGWLVSNIDLDAAGNPRRPCR